MRIGSAPLLPLNPLQPDRSEPYPRALGAAFVGKPYLTFPEVKAQPVTANPVKSPVPEEADRSRMAEGVKVRGGMAQLPEPRSTADPSGPLGARVDLLA